jgi:CDP-diacylglycerol--serine O-phosphatidyltransferase
MEIIKKGLPSFFTSLGLIAGCISIIVSISHKDLTVAGYLIIIAAIFDFIDGFVARWLNQISEFGKQLDSLSDVVSFGVAPAMILYQLLVLSYVKSSPGADFDFIHPAPAKAVIIYSAFLIAVFSALRLAKFNLDPLQTKNFRGLAVPANALFIAGLGFAAETSHVIPGSGIIFSQVFLLTVIVLSCFLLVSNIEMFSLKFSSLGFRENVIRYLFLFFSAFLLIIYKLPAFAPVIILYILMSLVNNRFVHMK